MRKENGYIHTKIQIQETLVHAPKLWADKILPRDNQLLYPYSLLLTYYVYQ